VIRQRIPQATGPRPTADDVAATGCDAVFAAERLLREMRGRSGGSLRLMAFQVKDAMDHLIALIDGGDQ
jgi:hypothetical protein